MSGLARSRIDMARVEAMHARQGEGERGSVLGRQGQTPMIGHQAISPARDAEATAGGRRPIAMEIAIALLEEYPLAPIAALGHRMGQAADDDASDAGHAAVSSRDLIHSRSCRKPERQSRTRRLRR